MVLGFRLLAFAKGELRFHGRLENPYFSGFGRDVLGLAHFFRSESSHKIKYSISTGAVSANSKVSGFSLLVRLSSRIAGELGVFLFRLTAGHGDFRLRQGRRRGVSWLTWNCVARTWA